MPEVLNLDAQLTCGTKGTATLTSTAKLVAGGKAVLLSAAATTWPIAGCKNATVPCTAIIAVAAGISKKLTVNGSPVLLMGAAGATNGTDAAFSTLVAGQSKLKAV